MDMEPSKKETYRAHVQTAGTTVAVHDDADTLPDGRKPPWYRRNPRGWRSGILAGTTAAFLTFIINIAVTGAAVSKVGGLALDQVSGSSQAGQPLYRGDCNKVRSLNIGAHFVINLLSTLLLSASNYGMQCLSAPTRSEVDMAHARGHWVHIGVSSVRNISKISGTKVFLWLILCFSSLPLHLFYNAAVYSSIYAREYVIYPATEAMLDPNSLWLGLSPTDSYGYNTFGYNTAQKLRDLYLNDTITRLEPQDCINTYAVSFQTQKGSLILVSTDSDSNGTTMPKPWAERTLSAVFTGGDKCAAHPFEWICGDTKWDCASGASTCATKWQSVDAIDWRPLGYKVSYCLVEDMEEFCMLRFEPQLAWVVVAFNLAKALVLLYVFLGVKEKPLLTMGDAVASFMARPDPTTAGLCMMSKASSRRWEDRRRGLVPEPVAFSPVRHRWATAASTLRWAVCMVLYTGIIALCLGLFLHGIVGRTVPAEQLLGLPFGAVDPRAFILSWGSNDGHTGTLLFNAFMANLPQLALSGIYFTYNGLFTCFLLGAEWSSYGAERKGLRVSEKPQGAQRASYFLQLPYRFAVPLMVLSGVLHWLCSQSIFLVSVALDDAEIFDDNSISISFLGTGALEVAVCGYSPRAILVVIVMGVAMVGIIVGVAQRRFRTAMPVGSSCSAAISAACHVPPGEDGDDSAKKPLKWGVTGQGAGRGSGGEWHCAFSAGEVEEPT